MIEREESDQGKDARPILLDAEEGNLGRKTQWRDGNVAGQEKDPMSIFARRRRRQSQ